MSKKILLLLLLLLALGAVVFFLEKPFEDDYVATSSKFFPEIESQEISRIEIEHFINGTVLQKSDDGLWTAKSFETALQKEVDQQEVQKKKNEDQKNDQVSQKENQNESSSEQSIQADDAKVARLINDILSLEKTYPISTNPQKKAQFQIMEKGLQIRLYGKNESLKAHLLVGKQGPELFTNYVSLPSSKEVYLVKAMLGPLLNRRLEDWKKTEAPVDDLEKTQ